ncbi:hypothetical protein RCO28_20635 [Streptomyces sp. LHD-70]|uniref:hypothetical protein n=1 Tax=Streptomyces sp. LHD-70 TaxID=3072140 RepID=UPI00280D99B4|nr:hypothetical protein [Streptomyces sp. LHD-70]MDQ8704880.1 hypothetical protein [Streptomyces sp. LHD-70]
MDHRLLGLEDGEAGREAPPLPQGGDEWFTTSPGKVLFQCEEEIIVLELRLQVWDAEAPLAVGAWDRSGEFGLDAPSGHLGQNLIAAGGDEAIDLPWPGRWRARASWKLSDVPFAYDEEVDDIDDDAVREPEAWLLVQFWPTAATDA